MLTTEGFEDVLRFWFPRRLSGAQAAIIRQIEWWFCGGADTDVAERFPLLLERAARGQLNSWSRRPRSRLALIIVLDQFSRSIHQGTAQAFAQDAKALALVLEGLDIGHYAALDTPWEKTFFFLPLGHSEDLRILDLAVKLAEGLVEEVPQEVRWWFEFSATQAHRHRDVIRRFGPSFSSQ
jgi:uncharacterized protein (DUF924 family)